MPKTKKTIEPQPPPPPAEKHEQANAGIDESPAQPPTQRNPYSYPIEIDGVGIIYPDNDGA